MFEDLAGNALVLWKADVDIAKTKDAIKVYRINANGTTTEMPNVTVVVDKDNKDLTKLTINVDDARSTAYELDKNYYAEIKFLDQNSEVLNTVKAPFTLSIPALSKFLVKETVVFVPTSTGKAYMTT